eukprot:PhM_4_TR9539/c0_g1_i1/m.103166
MLRLRISLHTQRQHRFTCCCSLSLFSSSALSCLRFYSGATPDSGNVTLRMLTAAVTYAGAGTSKLNISSNYNLHPATHDAISSHIPPDVAAEFKSKYPDAKSICEAFPKAFVWDEKRQCVKHRLADDVLKDLCKAIRVSTRPGGSGGSKSTDVYAAISKSTRSAMTALRCRTFQEFVSQYLVHLVRFTNGVIEWEGPALLGSTSTAVFAAHMPGIVMASLNSGESSKKVKKKKNYFTRREAEEHLSSVLPDDCTPMKFSDVVEALGSDVADRIHFRLMHTNKNFSFRRVAGEILIAKTLRNATVSGGSAVGASTSTSSSSTSASPSSALLNQLLSLVPSFWVSLEQIQEIMKMDVRSQIGNRWIFLREVLNYMDRFEVAIALPYERRENPFACDVFLRRYADVMLPENSPDPDTRYPNIHFTIRGVLRMAYATPNRPVPMSSVTLNYPPELIREIHSWYSTALEVMKLHPQFFTVVKEGSGLGDSGYMVSSRLEGPAAEEGTRDIEQPTSSSSSSSPLEDDAKKLKLLTSVIASFGDSGAALEDLHLAMSKSELALFGDAAALDIPDFVVAHPDVFDVDDELVRLQVGVVAASTTAPSSAHDAIWQPDEAQVSDNNNNNNKSYHSIGTINSYVDRHLELHPDTVAANPFERLSRAQVAEVIYAKSYHLHVIRKDLHGEEAKDRMPVPDEVIQAICNILPGDGLEVPLDKVLALVDTDGCSYAQVKHELEQNPDRVSVRKSRSGAITVSRALADRVDYDFPVLRDPKDIARLIAFILPPFTEFPWRRIMDILPSHIARGLASVNSKKLVESNTDLLELTGNRLVSQRVRRSCALDLPVPADAAEDEKVVQTFVHAVVCALPRNRPCPFRHEVWPKLPETVQALALPADAEHILEMYPNLIRIVPSQSIPGDIDIRRTRGLSAISESKKNWDIIMFVLRFFDRMGTDELPLSYVVDNLPREYRERLRFAEIRTLLQQCVYLTVKECENNNSTNNNRDLLVIRVSFADGLSDDELVDKIARIIRSSGNESLNFTAIGQYMSFGERTVLQQRHQSFKTFFQRYNTLFRFDETNGSVAALPAAFKNSAHGNNEE